MERLTDEQIQQIGDALQDEFAHTLMPSTTRAAVHNVTPLVIEALLRGRERDEALDRLNDALKQLQGRDTAERERVAIAETVRVMDEWMALTEAEREARRNARRQA